MNREDIIKLAREAGFKGNVEIGAIELERFAELIISHKLDEMASKVEQEFKGAFGADTCASWAAWLRSQK